MFVSHVMVFENVGEESLAKNVIMLSFDSTLMQVCFYVLQPYRFSLRFSSF